MSVSEFIDYADSTLNFVGASLGDRAHRALLYRVAAGEASGDEASEILAGRFGVTIDRTMQFPIATFDDYLIPGTTALRSRITDPDHPLGIIDDEQFRAIELALSHLRCAELARITVPGRLDYAHMQAYHRQLFRDVYPWAGQERVGPDTAMVRFARDAVNFEVGDSAAPMVKHSYYPGPQIAEAASVQFAQLEQLLRRKDLSRSFYLDLLPELCSELMTIHVFRDGNLRSQWVYALYFNRAMGFPMDLSYIADHRDLTDRMLHGIRRYQITGDPSPISGFIDEFFGRRREAVSQEGR